MKVLSLVKEGDVEAILQKTREVYEKKSLVEILPIYTFHEVVSEEIWCLLMKYFIAIN
ncbi:MAG: hypothetical protein QW741_03170 [Sulfolobales archaeon]